MDDFKTSYPIVYLSLSLMTAHSRWYLSNISTKSLLINTWNKVIPKYRLFLWKGNTKTLLKWQSGKNNDQVTPSWHNCNIQNTWIIKTSINKNILYDLSKSMLTFFFENNIINSDTITISVSTISQQYILFYIFDLYGQVSVYIMGTCFM